MGSLIEINDTLKTSKGRGFPAELCLEDHIADQAAAQRFIGQEFSFWNKGERLYHRSPTRVFLVEEIEGKWLYWGHVMVTKQTVSTNKTEGTFKIVKIYEPGYQILATYHETPEGKSYFSKAGKVNVSHP